MDVNVYIIYYVLYNLHFIDRMNTKKWLTRLERLSTKWKNISTTYTRNG